MIYFIIIVIILNIIVTTKAMANKKELNIIDVQSSSYILHFGMVLAEEQTHRINCGASTGASSTPDE